MGLKYKGGLNDGLNKSARNPTVVPAAGRQA